MFVKIVMKLLLIVTFFNVCLAQNTNSFRYYPRYHLAPPHGWMNDPNGFSEFRDEFHLFYQYNPKTSQEPGIAHWGHAVSRDLTNWEHRKIAMYPDQEYDKNGVFSGSAISLNDTLYLFYTGNVNQPDNTQYQALARSTDGVNVIKYPNNPIIIGEEYQPNIRDPKVWKHGNTYYMVLGNSYNNNTLGRVLLFKSNNMISWKLLSILDKSDGSLGYMWECPDFFPIDDYWILLFSPQGIKPQSDKYRNLYQTGYIVGNFDYNTGKFTPITKFVELDHGHDFYATQTILDKFGRRIVVAWFDMWEQVYPERDDGWAGQMTIARELHLTKDLKLLQKPIQELENIRACLLHSGKANSETHFKLNNNAAEIIIKAPKQKNFVLTLEAVNATVEISYDYSKSKISLDRGGNDGIRRTEWKPKQNILQLHIYIDRSSIELFCGDGEVTFSSRFFPDGDITVRLGEDSEAYEMLAYDMMRTIPKP